MSVLDSLARQRSIHHSCRFYEWSIRYRQCIRQELNNLVPSGTCKYYQQLLPFEEFNKITREETYKKHGGQFNTSHSIFILHI